MTKGLAMAIDAEIKGEWLREAVDAQGDSLSDCAKKLGLRYPTTMYNHANDVSYMGAKLLAALVGVYPTISLQYVLTGIGTPKLTGATDLSALKEDVRLASLANQRALKRLEEGG